MGLDIGPRTAAAIHREAPGREDGDLEWTARLLRGGGLCPGTLKVGEALANMADVFSVIGGGDTAAAIANHPWSARFSHISTGGGATLEYLEGIELPGVKALERRD